MSAAPRSLSTLLLTALLGSTACAEPAAPLAEPHACTLMACFAHASVTAHLGAADAAPGAHTFTLTADGSTQTCTLDVVDPARTAFGTCTGGASVRLGPTTRVVEDHTSMPGMVSATFVPVPGRFEWEVTIDGTPARVAIRHVLAGRTIVEREATPTYVDTRPNGPDCDPVCRVADVEWSVGDAR